jgi:hypothetical protein
MSGTYVEFGLLLLCSEVRVFRDSLSDLCMICNKLGTLVCEHHCMCKEENGGSVFEGLRYKKLQTAIISLT